jgi:hypothetical protein
MTKTFNQLIVCILVCATSTFWSCIDPDDFEHIKAEYSPSFTIPLVNSELRVQELVNQEENKVFILVDPDGFIRLEYYDEVFSQSASGLITIPDQQLNLPGINTLPIAPIPGGPTTTFSYTDSGTTTLQVPNNAGFQEVTFKSGTVTFRLNSNLTQAHQITVTLPDFILNGSPLVFQFNLSGPGPAQSSQSMAGRVANLAPLGSRNNIRYRVQFSAPYNSSNGFPGLNLSSVSLEFAQPGFSSVKGYIGQMSIPIATSRIEVNVFNNFVAGDLLVTSPSVDLLVKNSFGFPVNALISPLNVRSNELGVVNITGPFFGSPVSLSFPDLSRIGQFDTTRLRVDNTSSNIVSVFESAPRELNYGLTLSSNAPDPTASHFITDSSKISVDARVVLPLEGQMRIFTIQDTFDVNLGDLESENIKRAFIKVYMDNKLPFDTDIQLYFMDSSFAIIDSLLNNEQRIIASGIIDGQGRVVTPTVRVTDIPVTNEKLKSLERAKKVFARGRMRTSNGGFVTVRIFEDNRLFLRLGLQVDLNFSENL